MRSKRASHAQERVHKQRVRRQAAPRTHTHLIEARAANTRGDALRILYGWRVVAELELPGDHSVGIESETLAGAVDDEAWAVWES